MTAYDNVTAISIDVATGEVDGITITAPQVFVPFEFTKNSSNYTEEGNISLENGSTYYTTTLNLMIPRREQAKRNAISLLAAGQQNLLAIIEDQNGKYWLMGEENGANLTAKGEGSGTAKADGSKYSLTLTAEEPELMREVDPTIIAGLL